MKLPKTVKRYNPVLRKHTEMKVSLAKKRTPGATSPMSQGSKVRRGFGKGHGNLGTRGSKPAASKFKMGNKKRSKRADIRFECQESKKSFGKKHTFRAKKIEFM